MPLTKKNILSPADVKIEQDIEIGAILGTLTFFVGNGVSRLYGLPSWDEFANKILEKLVEKKKITYLNCRQLKSRPLRERISIGHKIFKRSNLDYNEILTLKAPKKNGVYQHLKKCGNRFITTNYDLFLDNILRETEKEPTQRIKNNTEMSTVEEKKSENKYRTFYSIQEVRKNSLINNNLLIHLHGSIKKQDEMVVATSEYLDLYGNEKYKDILRLFFKDKKVVIIGYGLSEIDILDNIFRPMNVGPTGKKDIFLLLPLFSYQEDLADQLKDYYETLMITIIPYCIDDGYKALETIMQNWAEKLSKIKTASSFCENTKIIDSILEFSG